MTRRAPAASTIVALTALAALAAAAGGCVNEVAIGLDRVAGGGAGGSSSAGLGGAPMGGSAGESGGGAGATGCTEHKCGSRIYACGDCDDNDMDGSIDAADSQCLGPCDDTEDSYYPNILGQNTGSCRQDCYFDTGAGTNDQCFSSFRCDPYSVEPGYPPSADPLCSYDPATNIPGTNASCDDLRAMQSDTCGAACGPLVPNGCDCFGCCELPTGSDKFVWIGSNIDGVGTCTEASVDDPEACRPCTQIPSCTNPCGECEICAGRQTPGEGCTTGESDQCPADGTACGLSGQAACEGGYYCITGCCVEEPR